MKKVLATLLAICLMFSAVGTALVVSAEGETAEGTVQTPVYTASTTNWEFATVEASDNTLFDSAYFLKKELPQGKRKVLLEGDVWSMESAAAWIEAGVGEVRFWVKLPYMDGAPELDYRVDFSYVVTYTKSDDSSATVYPNVETTTPIKADGLWHEIRISAASFTASTNFINCVNGTFVSPSASKFYALRIEPATAQGVIAAEGGFYVGTSVEYYNEAIAAEVNDGNTTLEQVAAIDTADGYGGGCTNISVQKNIAISGNKFYNTAVAYSVTDATNYTFSQDNVLPYKIGTPTGNEFKEVVTNGGDARTYVKNVSDHEMTFTVGIKTWCKVTETGSGGNFLLNKTVTVPNDGKWHEVRISFKNLNTDEYKLNALKGVEGYTYGTVYLRIYDLNGDFTTTDDKLYITPLAIYNRSLIGSESADINDANVVLKQISSVATPSGGWSHKSVSGASVNIADNKFYRSAFKYTVTDVATQSFSSNTYPYINANITIDELTDYFKYRGDMRTYIKNTSDHTMTFSIGIKVKYNSSSNAESRFKTVEIPGDGKWHEVRISYSDLFVNTTDNIYKAMNGIDDYTLNELYLKINGLTGQFTSTDDEIYFTALEIYNRDIDTAETTDFAREYKQAMLLTTYRSDKTNTNISKESVAVENVSPFFSNAVTYTANDSYTAGYTSGQIGFVHGSGIDAEAFADWYYNDNADLRIWVKAEKDTKIKLGIFVSGNNYGEVGSSAISVAASSDWQLITVPRSLFNTSNQIVTAIAGRDTIDVNIFFYSVDGTFAQAGDSISIAQCVEVYSDKAYDKGDANCDTQVDIRDLVHVKKQAVAIDANVKNSDIDNSGDIDTSDLVLIRKKLLIGTWN